MPRLGDLGVRGNLYSEVEEAGVHGLAQGQEQALDVEFRTMSRMHGVAGGQSRHSWRWGALPFQEMNRQMVFSAKVNLNPRLQDGL